MDKIATIVKEYLLVLVSGGRSSARMARHIQQSPKYDRYEKLYVFCNSGQERPETIQFLKDIVFFWDIPLVLIEGIYPLEPGEGIKHKIVDFDTLNMTGEPYSGAIAYANKNREAGVPCDPAPYCSDYIKTRPSHHLAKVIFGTNKYIKALGYRKEDMPKRITFAELKEDKKRIAPLITDFDEPIGRYELTPWFDSQPFKLNLPSNLGNCELCWKKGDKNLVAAIKYGTRFIDWHKQKEEQYGNKFFRENKSITDLVRLAQETGDQLDLFDTKEEEDFKCVCNF